MFGNKTSRDPTGQTENRSQRTSFLIHEGVKRSIDQRDEKPIIGNEAQRKLIKWEFKEESRCEIEENESREEDWPNEQHVYEAVHWVAVVCAVEGEVFLEIE